jgi:hypothetical protein
MIGLGFATNETGPEVAASEHGSATTEPPLGIVSLIEVSIARILLYLLPIECVTLSANRMFWSR